MLDEPANVLREPASEDGRLAENVAHFVRALRRAGLPVGPGHVLRAVGALRTIDIMDRDEFYWALHTSLITRQDQREVFDQAFHMFWRSPDYLERMMSMFLPTLKVGEEAPTYKRELSRRVADALGPAPPQAPEGKPQEELEVDASMTFSTNEVLKTIDFDSMSADEEAAAKRAMARLTLPLQDPPTRRFRSDADGRRADLRASLRSALRGGPGVIPLKRKTPRTRPPSLVALCDISGSMARYSRMLLHFLHALSSDRDRVHSFVFGTRLTNVTRHMRGRDVDLALEQVANSVDDWEGGTRIGWCLERFNKEWSRRVLGQGAVVLLITDGLDREVNDVLAAEADRLAKSCRRLIWLNPLLRYDGFEPKAGGVTAILPHVDEFRATHNLESLEALAAALSGPSPALGARGADQWQRQIQRP